MTANDLILAILDSEGGHIRSTIELVNELTSDLLDENPQSSWGNALAEELEDFASKHDRCPTCGSRMEYFNKKGEISEYFGQEVIEDYCIARCSECEFEIDYNR